MKRNFLKNAISSVLQDTTSGKMRNLISRTTSRNTKHDKEPELPLASACDDGIFPLFNLPIELIEAIICEMVSVLGFYRAVRLRFVNKLFDKNITNIIFSQHNAGLLPAWTDGGVPPNRTAQVAFARILERKIGDETSARSPLYQSITGCIDLLESLPSPYRSDALNPRQLYTSILCVCAVNNLSMRAAIQSLSAGDETPVEAPSEGALIVASSLGDIPLIEALIAQGSRVDNQSSLFGSAIEAAAERGHINAVKALLKHSDINPSDIFGAIRGGHKDIVQLFLDECYTETWFTKTLLDDFTDYSEYTWKYRRYMVLSAANNDQTSLLDTFINYFPITHRPKILREALYHAVFYSSMTTIASLLDAGVDISRYVEAAYGDGLYLASKRGDLKTVQLLVEHGCEDFIWGLENHMHVAAAKGHTDVVQFFLERGVDVNCRFHSPSAPAGKYYQFWDQISAADPATKNAARNGDFHMFCFLVRRGCRVDLDNELGPLQRLWLGKIQAWEAKAGSSL